MDIEGITVLSQKVEEVVVTGEFNMTQFSLLLFGIAVIAFIGWLRLAWICCKKDRLGTGLLAGLVVSIICGLCIAGGFTDGTETTTYELNTYSVTITDDVSFREVVDDYNLISRDGEIFVLQEKIPEE
jgi:hypothetical protein